MDWELILFSNPHWEKNWHYEFEHERTMLSLLKQDKTKLMTLLIGPRRVGKTVLLKQMINHLISQNVPRTNILFITHENNIDPIEAVIKWRKEFNISTNDQTYLFFDEIQYVEGWAEKIKFIYDNMAHAKIYLSGSASARINKGKESLAGRVKELFVGPLSFEEYLRFSGKPRPHSAGSLWDYYKEYLFKQLPDIALGEEPRQYIASIVDKVVGGDLIRFFGSMDEELAKSLIRIVLKRPGQMIEYRELANVLGVDRNTLSKYMNALCDSFLLRKAYSFSRNARKVEKRRKKFYPFYTSLVNYVWPLIPEDGLLLETDVFEKLDASFYFNERGKEIDVVLPEQSCGVEVKTGKRVDCADLKTLINATWLRKKVVVCPPTTEVLCDKVEVVHPFSVQHVCNKHANH